MTTQALRRFDTVDEVVGWFGARGVHGLAADSRRVRPGDAFLGWPGHGADGRRFVRQALAAGAVACLIEAVEHPAVDGIDADALAGFEGLKAATGEIADRFFGEPSRALDLFAVTGTNGKTSTAWWVAQALSRVGQRCGVIGTLGIGEPPSTPPSASKSAPAVRLPIEPTGLTTPGPLELHAGLRRLVDAGFAACAIEATSIGMAEHRLAGARIGIAVFTNFTQDHLDYHGSMAAYWEAKARLFAWPGLRAAVVNVDDPRGAELAERLVSTDRADAPLGGTVDVWTCSARGPARLVASNPRYLAPEEGGGLGFDLAERTGGEATAPARVRTGIVGDFHLGNLLVAIGTLRAAGVPLAAAVAACATLTPVPGRMQRVDPPAGAGAAPLPLVVVDYAHTPDALEKALGALRPLCAGRGGALVCVFGCGGDRDPGKRPLMGAIAARLADRTIVTSDNPRGEPPERIVAAVVAGWPAGAPAPEPIVDRRAAIARAVASAAPADVVLLAGKGHETTQEIAGIRYPMSDVDEAAAALARRVASSVGAAS